MRKILFESLTRRSLTEAPPARDDAMLAELAANVDRAARRRLGRSLSIREIDAGSCNDCALDGGIFSGSYAVVGGVAGVVPVDLHIRGCPPRPEQLLKGLLALLETQ